MREFYSLYETFIESGKLHIVNKLYAYANFLYYKRIECKLDLEFIFQLTATVSVRVLVTSENAPQ